MMVRLLREPLLHFFFLGTVLFALFGWVTSDTADAPAEIVVDDARVAGLEAQFRRIWQRSPTEEELHELIEGWIREETLYREGLAMGLDRDDPVIRKRVAQKLAFISEDLMTVDPTEAELRAWLEERPDDYRIEPTTSFRQIFFTATEDDRVMASAVRATHIRLGQGEPAEILGDATLLPHVLSAVSSAHVTRMFGTAFSAALDELTLGKWHGPVESEFGVHLVQVVDRTPGRVPELDEVRAALERDLVRARLEESNQQFFAALRARYRVELVGERADSESADADGRNEG